MDIFGVISLLGGIGMFLYGMEIMGDGLKNSSAETLKRVLGRLTQNTLMGVITGTIVTAVIQSSTATIVLAVGLITAGILNLRQAASIVMGANIGTTATAQIIRLMDIDSTGNVLLEFFKPSTLAPVAVFVGIILIMFVKKRDLSNVGAIFMGFGVLFTGIMTMTSAVQPLAESEMFIGILSKFTDMPVLGIFTGMVTTVMVQSSSVMVGILQSLSTTGIMNFNVVYPMIMGINIGTCIVTAFICSIGSTKDAKRTAVVHILFNTIGTVVFMIVLGIVQAMGFFPELWNKVVSSGDIANFQTLFNLFTAILLLPFTNVLVNLSTVIIKSDGEGKTESYGSILQHLDEKLFISPAIAIQQATEAAGMAAEIAQNNIFASVSQLEEYSGERAGEILEREDILDDFADKAGHYLVQLSKDTVGDTENRHINILMHNVMSIERIGDYATNIAELSEELQKISVGFSEKARSEMSILVASIKEITEMTLDVLKNSDYELAKKVEPLEQVIDNMVAVLKDRHIERLKNGECSIEVGLVFIESLTNLERVADQCSNIAVQVMSQNDESIMLTSHEYMRNLHMGKDAEYELEYKKKSEEYMTALKGI